MFLACKAAVASDLPLLLGAEVGAVVVQQLCVQVPGPLVILLPVGGISLSFHVCPAHCLTHAMCTSLCLHPAMPHALIPRRAAFNFPNLDRIWP